MALHRLIAFSSITSNTGPRSPGEELMTCNTSAVGKFSLTLGKLTLQIGYELFGIG